MTYHIHLTMKSQKLVKLNQVLQPESQKCCIDIADFFKNQIQRAGWDTSYIICFETELKCEY